ncbi:TPA: hypothetical protein IXZ05_000663 [Enterococcus faecium]|nr:hypothetical protein [Enterococcus faecium]HAQ6089527.1 hypothetical protein [Enterococcus faecium]
MVGVVKFLGFTFDGYGTLGEWVGIILIVITIQQTSKYYWYSNSSKIVSRITEGITKKDITVVGKYGFTITLLNEGKSETAIKFCGIIGKYNIFQRFIRKHWYKYIYKYPVVKKLIEKYVDHEISYLNPTDLINQEFQNIGCLEKGLKIPIVNESLVTAMVANIKNSKKLEKRYKKCKKLKFSFLFLEYNGKEYYQDIYVLRGSNLYKDIKNKISV